MLNSRSLTSRYTVSPICAAIFKVPVIRGVSLAVLEVPVARSQINFQLSPEQRQLFDKAAAIAGKRLSAWMREELMWAAQGIIARDLERRADERLKELHGG